MNNREQKLLRSHYISSILLESFNCFAGVFRKIFYTPSLLLESFKPFVGAFLKKFRKFSHKMVSRFFNHPQFMLENSAYTSVFWAIFLSYNCYYEKYSDGSVKNIQDEIPFDLPVGWAWSRLKTLSASIQYGVNDSAKTSGSHRLLRITDIQNGSVNWNTVPYTTVNDTKYSLSINDIVFARTGATVGKSFLIKEVPALAVYASYLIRIRLVEPRCANYIYKFFNSSNYWAQITDKSIGVGQPNCNGTSLSQLFIPVPPLNEQASILTIVENILSLIEHIDVSKCEIEECSRQIKSKILELAIQGKLVPQDENDEPANVLLERIRTERKAKLGKKYVESYIFKGDDNCYYLLKFDCFLLNSNNVRPKQLICRIYYSSQHSTCVFLPPEQPNSREPYFAEF